MVSGRRSSIALAVAALLCIGSLAGCGGSGSSTGSSPGKTTADRPAGRQSQTAQGDSGAGSKDQGQARRADRGKATGDAKQPHDAGGSTANGAAAGNQSNSAKTGAARSGGAKSGDAGAKPASAGGKKSGGDGGGPSKAKSTPTSHSEQSADQETKPPPKATKDPSQCKSQRCLQEQVAAAEAAGGGQPSPADQCPTGMSAAECEAAGKLIEEGGGTVQTTPGCPAAMSEAECRAVTEAYEAATK
jgi:hypothetical protein